jgi:hypothetical protein
MHNTIEKLQESTRLVGSQEGISAYEVRTKARKTHFRTKKQVAAHFASVFAKVLHLLKLEGHLLHFLPKGCHLLSFLRKVLLQLLGASAGSSSGVDLLVKVTSKPWTWDASSALSARSFFFSAA